ncbi:MAG: GAF domain-containing sensor histidine kinase [Candidatus Acidiferrales bacterium]
MRAGSRSRDLSSRLEGDFERLLARILVPGRKRTVESVIRLYCRSAKAFFNAEGVSYWEFAASDEVVVRHSEGQPRFPVGHRSLRLSENALFVRAFSSRRVVLSRCTPAESSPADAIFGAPSWLLVPVQLSGNSRGVFVLVYRAALLDLNPRVAKQAEIFAAVFEATAGSLLRAPSASAAERRAQGLMNLAVELKPALRLPEFVGQFTLRAAEMLGARAAILALTRSARLETVYSHNVSGKTERPALDAALTKLAAEDPRPLLLGSAATLLGPQLASSLGWRHLCFARLTGREGDLLGAICLVDRGSDLSDEDRNLVHALAGHASVALENSRLFSRIEQSKRQWVEDFDAISDLIVVHDPANRIVRVNRSLAESLGSRPSELIGMSTRTLSSIAADSGRACPFCRELGPFAEEAVLASGMKAFLVSTSRIGSGSDEGSRTIHILKDITEQRTYQAQLQRERDFNTKILNHTQSMILVLDTAGLVSYANRRCYEAGYREKDLLGRALGEYIPRDRRALFQSAFDTALHGFASENLELPVLRGNRSTGRFSMSFSPMRDEQGHVNSIVIVMTDITDAAVLQAQLRNSEKMAALGQLVSGVAHEINNPLAAIVGYSDLLLENPDISDSAKGELRIVLQEAERTKGIVQNLLHFARQMPARREAIDIHSVLGQVLQLRAYGSAGQSVEVVERFGSSLPHIYGDAHQLQQVFLNILNNAYDAVNETGRAGKIEIITSERDGSIEITIRDNGTGLSNTERIFEPFYTTKDVGKGTGLGLSICYGIVREHGGEVLCANNSDGVGCAFLVRLPTAEARAFAAISDGAR